MLLSEAIVIKQTFQCQVWDIILWAELLIRKDPDISQTTQTTAIALD